MFAERYCAFTPLGKLSFLAVIIAFGIPQQVIGKDWTLDSFEDGDLRSELGWVWEAFAIDDEETISVQVSEDAEGNHRLVATGKLPDKGTGFTYGGVLCVPEDTDRPTPESFEAFRGIAFRASSDSPSYYSLRIEHQELRHNSTNVVFPVTRSMQEFFIPLSEFKTGISLTTGLAFTRLVDTPGASFHLELDDIRFVSEAPSDATAARLESMATWAPSLEVAWQNANFQSKPLLLYFWSDFAVPCHVFEDRLIEAGSFDRFRDSFVLAKVDVNQNRSFVQQCNVWRVPAFMVLEPGSGRRTVLYAGNETGELETAVLGYLQSRADLESASESVAPAERYHVVTIDSFSDRNELNDVGGKWGTFAAGDTGAIVGRFVDLGGGNLAYEADGHYPNQQTGTFGGIFCDLAPDRATPRNLASFRWISFITKSSTPGMYQIHLEDSQGGRSPAVQFQVTTQPLRVTIPLARFGPVVGNTTTLVWTDPNPVPGGRLNLLLDDLMVIQ
jgi:hypothetical protein